MTEQTEDQQEPTEALQITPPRTFVNASTTDRYTSPTWAVRPGADDHKRHESRGF